MWSLVVTWNEMVARYAHNGLVDEALKFFENIPERDLGFVFVDCNDPRMHTEWKN